MGWIVGVQSKGAMLALVEAGDAETRAVRAVDTSLEADLVDGKRRTRFMAIDLTEFTRLDMTETTLVAHSAGIPLAVIGVQSLYSVEHVGRRIVVPSQVLVHAFVGGTRAHRSALLSPAGFQALGVLTVTDGLLGVTYASNFEKKPPDRSSGLTQTILWTGAYPSARRMHSSVLRHALDGRFDIDLPKAKVTMSFMGAYLDNGTMLATRITLAAVEPLEPPMAHAVGVVQPKFEFAVVDERRLVKGTANTGPRGPKGSGLEADLADVGYATALGDKEWDQVRAILLRHRAYQRELGAREREKLDVILRKFSTGLPWTQVAGSVSRAQLVQRFFKDLESNESWPEVKALLVVMRGAGSADSAPGREGIGKGEPVRTAGSFTPSELRHIRTRIAEMTQVEFAAFVQVGASTVSGWERGERQPTSAAARRLQLLEVGGVEALT